MRKSFIINLGLLDKVNEIELLNFISDNTAIARSEIETVDLYEREGRIVVDGVYCDDMTLLNNMTFYRVKLKLSEDIMRARSSRYKRSKTAK